MTFSLQISGGDLVQQGSQFGVVFGAGKLQQDMTLWLAERYGIDPLHPNYGSELPEYIGSMITPTTQSVIYNEVMRVLENYQKMQYQGFKRNPQLYSLAELLWSITSVNVGLSYDSVSVGISVTNGQSSVVSTSLTQGVS